MQRPGRKRSFPSTAALVALGLATLATAARLAQLAVVPVSGACDAGPLACVPPADSSPDQELAKLYAACPMAAVIDLKTVATSRDKVDELVPPYRETAHR